MKNKWQLVNYSFHAMGSPCHVQFYSPNKKLAQRAKKVLKQCVQTLEQRYSRYRDDSLISQINDSAGLGKATPIDAETAALLGYAEQCYQESDGLFDVTSGILRQLWSLDKTRLPTEAEREQLLPLIGWNKLEWSADSVYLPLKGMQLDFGGIVKEYAADSVVRGLQQLGINSGLVELGGDIKVIGPLPNGDGWPVAIRDPRKPETLIVQLNLKAGALASSGDYERFQMIEGVRYSHLLNPKTAMPVTGLQGVSVISEHCVIAGSVATIAMLKAEQGLSWLKNNEVSYFCCSSDGQIEKNM